MTSSSINEVGLFNYLISTEKMDQWFKPIATAGHYSTMWNVEPLVDWNKTECTEYSEEQSDSASAVAFETVKKDLTWKSLPAPETTKKW